MQPALLDPKKSSQVCGQCHGIWEFYDGAAERRADTAGLPFRPGDELADTRFVAQPSRNGDSPTMQALLAEDTGFVRDSFWPDGTVRVSGREYNGLIESPCFVKATDPGRTLSCASCHTLHQKADDPRPRAEWAVDQLGCGHGRERGLHPVPFVDSGQRVAAHPSCRGLVRQRLLQLPHAVHHLRAPQDDPQPHHREPLGGGDANAGRPNACNLCHVDKTLRWTSDALARWYGQPPATLTADQERISSMALMALEGDAGQRVIAAEAFRWPPAQQASGTSWMAPFVAQLLDDSYDAIRFSAGRALKALPGFEGVEYDFVAGPRARRQQQLQVMRRWDAVAARRPAQRERRPARAGRNADGR